MDRAKLRSQVFEKTGIKVDVDDPIFALVALNEAVLEQTVDRHLERIEAASMELAQHARSAGGLPPAPQAAPATPPTAPGLRPIATAHEGFSPREIRLLAAAAGVAVLAAVLVLAGQSLFRNAPALTPAQQAALARAEKLDKILPTLDAKVHTAVEEALAKP
jgi:hypothetical protein